MIHTFLLKSTKTNQQTPHTQIRSWIYAAFPAPWLTILMQPASRSIMTQVDCEPEVKDQLVALITAAIAYSDANWGVANQTCITQLAATYPNALAPEALAFLQA